MRWLPTPSVTTTTSLNLPLVRDVRPLAPLARQPERHRLASPGRGVGLAAREHRLGRHAVALEPAARRRLRRQRRADRPVLVAQDADLQALRAQAVQAQALAVGRRRGRGRVVDRLAAWAWSDQARAWDPGSGSDPGQASDPDRVRAAARSPRQPCRSSSLVARRCRGRRCPVSVNPSTLLIVSSPRPASSVSAPPGSLRLVVPGEAGQEAGGRVADERVVARAAEGALDVLRDVVVLARLAVVGGAARQRDVDRRGPGRVVDRVDTQRRR